MREIYLERGAPVRVLVSWRAKLPAARLGLHLRPAAPRNVLIQRADGTLVVRPFRGLRRAA